MRASRIVAVRLEGPLLTLSTKIDSEAVRVRKSRVP